MDKEKIAYLNGVVDRLLNFGAEQRTMALTQLFSLRTAAVEDLTAASNSDFQNHWDSVLESQEIPSDVRSLIRDLIQLTNDELTMIGTHIPEKTHESNEQIISSFDDQQKAAIRSQIAASANR